MFYYLNGTLAKLDVGAAVIDCNGVGYLVNISAICENKIMTSLGKTIKLYTYFSVREDAMELYGFLDNDELETFKLLISVSGVGNKTALAVLGNVTPEQFAIAISTGNLKALKVHGVGPKIAARIMLELKDKVSGEKLDGVTISDDANTPVSSGGNKMIEARSALMTLGFSRSEADGLLRPIDCTKLTVEEIIHAALKKV